jgi:hypothetical protein
MTWREPQPGDVTLENWNVLYPDDMEGGEPDTVDDEMALPDAPEPEIDDDV